MKISGAEAVFKSLIEEKVRVIFGYPGGGNMPIYDALYDYMNQIRHILVRHEQGAIHAAEGYARVSGKPGVCFATSGPGATNLVTGIADAMMDSIPVVCVTGQVASQFLGTDAFQEADIIGITTPITKWNYQITKASEIPEVFAKAFYVAVNGRPGPVLIDITKNAQFEMIDFSYPKKFIIKKLSPDFLKVNNEQIIKIAEIINRAKKPFFIIGHGVSISKAEKELMKVAKVVQGPVATTLLGLGAFPADNNLYVGMLGMHGHFSPNLLTNKADVIVAIGMRFDDRVTSNISKYAPRATIIHIDIDASEINKNIQSYLGINADAKKVLQKLLHYLKKNNHLSWLNQFKKYNSFAENKISQKNGDKIKMNEVVSLLSKITKGEAIIVADVGQNQMFSARYYQYKHPNSYVTSGGLGTMGFALPASIGAKIASPKKPVIAIIGDGGFQMTIQELGTIMQEKLPVKIIVLNNGYLGMVRQWQEMFFKRRYSFTYLDNPDFVAITNAYKIKASRVFQKDHLENKLVELLNFDGPILLEVEVEKEENVFPMVPVGAGVHEVRLK